MTAKQTAALLNAHKNLLTRIADLEAEAVVAREVLFLLLDSLVPKDGKPQSVKFEEILNKIQQDRWAIANREAGMLQDAILENK